MKKKKLLYIAVSSQTGGVPKHIMNALQYAKERNYDITVAVPSDGDYYPWFRETAANMIDLSLKPYSIGALWKLREYVKKSKIELIHSHGKGAGMYARPLRLLCPGVRIVHTFHGIYLEQYKTGLREIYCWIEHFLGYLTDQFICVSQSEREEALRLGFAEDKKIRVICNGVNIELFDAIQPQKLEYRNLFGFAEDDYVIVCVARLEKMKGHLCLLRAFAQLVLDYPKCRLLLVGDGPDRKSIEKEIQMLEIEERVVLAGFRHDVPQLLKSFDLFASMSLKEGMPYTLVEALAAEIPIVATNVIGNRDVIKDGVNGFLTEVEDVQAVKRVMEYAIKNPELCEQYSQQGKCDAETHFTVQASEQQLFNLYEELLGEL